MRDGAATTISHPAHYRTNRIHLHSLIYDDRYNSPIVVPHSTDRSAPHATSRARVSAGYTAHHHHVGTWGRERAGGRHIFDLIYPSFYINGVYIGWADGATGHLSHNTLSTITIISNVDSSSSTNTLVFIRLAEWANQDRDVG